MMIVKDETTLEKKPVAAGKSESASGPRSETRGGMSLEGIQTIPAEQHRCLVRMGYLPESYQPASRSGLYTDFT